MTATISTTLSRAADILEKRGRCRGEYYDRENGRVCAAQAMSIASGSRLGIIGGKHYRNARNFLSEYLGMGVSKWNDSEPDDAVVLATIREAARAAGGAA